MNPHQCPFCTHRLEPIGEPQIGNFILCGACGAALRYEIGFALREMTTDEAIVFPHISELFRGARASILRQRRAE